MSDFDGPVAQRVVQIRGKSVTLRAVSAMESARVREAFPRPMAPMTSFSRKGSVATPLPYPVPDEADEKYRRLKMEWELNCALGDLAIGLAWETATGVPAGTSIPAAPSLIEAVKEMRTVLTDAELGRLCKAQNDLASDAEEAALKNSSAPPAAGTTSCDGTGEAASSSSATGSPGPSC